MRDALLVLDGSSTVHSASTLRACFRARRWCAGFDRLCVTAEWSAREACDPSASRRLESLLEYDLGRVALALDAQVRWTPRLRQHLFAALDAGLPRLQWRVTRGAPPCLLGRRVLHWGELYEGTCPRLNYRRTPWCGSCALEEVCDGSAGDVETTRGYPPGWLRFQESIARRLRDQIIARRATPRQKGV